ncbi:MAG: hypothetical protein ACFFCW_38990 [Candidatus Hodarchaeota archaeon]
MPAQLPLEFDQEKLKFMKYLLTAVDQRAIIKGLVEIYLEYIQIENRRASEDERDD